MDRREPEEKGALPYGEAATELVEEPATQHFDLPYPGLRPFERREAQLFFGRNRCVDSMVETLDRTRMLAVLGPSGSGKSSLVRTGLFEALEGGLAPTAGPNWVIADIKHPGGHPFRELARSLLQATGEQFDDIVVERLRSELRKGPSKLAEWWLCRASEEPQNLLILVDQFEELFRYGDADDRDRIEAFVDLLLETLTYPDLRIHVVLTMRSEYLGACALVPGLAEAINRSLSLTPRMTQAECMAAIVGPSRIVGFDIEPALTNDLLNDMNDLAPWEEEGSGRRSDSELDEIDRIARRADQLPLMQHVLNRLWVETAKKTRAGQRVLLRQKHYHDEGRLQGALDKHADDVMKNTGEPVLTERLFRALTSGSSVATAVRRQRTIKQLVAEIGYEPTRVCKVVKAFSARDCHFLSVTGTGDLRDGDTVDISHESLIRQWTKLSAWLIAEAEEGRIWRDLRRAAAREEQDGLLSGKALEARSAWLASRGLTDGWIVRYGGEEKKVREFIARGVEADRRRQRRARIAAYGTVGALGTAALVSLGVFAWASSQAASARASALAAERSEQMSHDRADKAAAAERKARSIANEALRIAGNARTETKRAKALTALAVAREKAAAASAKAARAQQLHALAESERLKRGSEQLAVEFHDRLLRPQIAQARASGPIAGEFELLKTAFQGNILRTSNPAAHAALSREVKWARGSLNADDLDVPETAKLAAALEDSGNEAEAVSPSERSMRRAAAAILRGRIRMIEGDSAAAISQFESASAELGDAAGDDALLLQAEAHFRKASALLDSSSTDQASRSAGDCLAVLEAAGRLDSPRPGKGSASETVSAVAEIPAFDEDDGRSVLAGRCQTLLAASAGEDPEAAELWRSAARSLLAARAGSGDLDIARADMLTRYFRRIKRVPGYDPAIVELQNTTLYRAREKVRSLTVYDDPKISIGITRSEALAQVALIAEVTRPLLKRATTREMASLLDLPQRVLVRLSQHLPAQAPQSVRRQVAQAFSDHAEQRLAAMVSAANESAAPGMDFVLYDSARFLEAYAAFALELPQPDAKTHIEQARRIATEMLRASHSTMPSQRYRAPDRSAAVADRFVEALCNNDRFPRSDQCEDLKEVAEKNRAHDRGVVENLKRLAGYAVATVPAFGWADENGIALGGIDTVGCFTQAYTSTALGWSDRLTSDAVATEGAASAADAPIASCYPLRGRYGYYHPHGGQMFLFDNAENRRAFIETPGRYGAGFDGYDLMELAEGRRCRPKGGVTVGYIRDSVVYLTDSRDAPTALTFSKAFDAWKKIGPTANAAGPAEDEGCE